MLVGEQPGDKEDLAGKPFVGPAGKLLDRALADAGIPRDQTFVTNAVKHFKFEPRGQAPAAQEAERLRDRALQMVARPGARHRQAAGGRGARCDRGAQSARPRRDYRQGLRAETLHLADGTRPGRHDPSVRPCCARRTRPTRRAAYAAFVKDLKLVARLRFQARPRSAGPPHPLMPASAGIQ
jgi:DNA polymerase